MGTFDLEVLSRLPLAKAVLLVMRHACDADHLNAIFEEHRGRCYEMLLKFSALVDLVGDALLEHEGSARKAFRDGRNNGQLAVSDQAAYGKLRRLPLEVSQEFLSKTTIRIQELLPDEVVTPLPKSLLNLQVFAVDGKKVKKLAKRLKPARGVDGKVLGGKTLVARDLHFGTAVAMQAHPDGEANDTPLVPGLLRQIKELYPDGDCLWILDSQFCDLTTPRRIRACEHQFLVRYHPKVQFHRDDSCEIRQGVDSRNRDYHEDFGLLGSPRNKSRMLVRRIVVPRADKSDLILITSLLDMDAFPADDLLTAYAARWTIETMFQQITEVFNLQRLIGGTAQASVFQCAFCLLLFNIIHLLRIHLSVEHDQEIDDISTKNVLADIQDQLTVVRILLPTSKIVEQFAVNLTATQARHQIQQLLRSVWQDHWNKAPKNPRGPRPKLRKISGGHTSIFRLIKQYRAGSG